MTAELRNLVVGIVFWLACYGLLTVIADVLRWLANRDLRQRGHDLRACDICSGGLKRKHERAIQRWMIKRGAR